jgi:predicted O-methyltransferase YrrM
MNITKRLLELDPTLSQHNEGAWDKPFDPTLPSYSSFNDAGIEVETGEFLYAMTRLLKPDRVLETGTHWGIGAAYMGTALKDNHT